MNQHPVPVAALVALAAGMALAATPHPLPCTNDFEAYPDGTRLNTLTNEGWDASGNSVTVQTAVVPTNRVSPNLKAVAVPADAILTNVVAPAPRLTNVWIDCEVRLVPHQDAEAPAVNSNAVSMTYLDAAGYLRLYNRDLAAWATLSNDVQGAAVPAVTNHAWARVTLNHDYAGNTCAVFLNGQALADRVPFISNVTQCAAFRVLGAQGDTTYFDNYGMTLAVPAGLTNDANHDGIADADEIHQFGYIARQLRVGPAEPFTTLQAAVDAALGRDTIVMVGAGPYAESVSIPHAIGGITGQGFALTGSLSVATPTTSLVGFACGTLGVSNSAALAVAGNVSAGDTTLGSAAVLALAGSLTNRDLTLATGAAASVGGGLASSNMTLNAGARLAVSGPASALAVSLGAAATLAAGSNWSCASLATDTGATGTISGALSTAGALHLGTNAFAAVASTATVGTLQLDAGAVLAVTNALTVSNTATLAANARVSTGGSMGAGNTALDTASALALGGGLNASNLTLASSAAVTLAGSLTAWDTALGDGARLSAGSSALLNTLTTGRGATGTITGPLTASGALHLGTNGLLTVGGLLGCGSLGLDAAARLSASGSVTVSGAVTLGASASATAAGALASRDMALGPAASLTLGGTLGVSNLTLDADARLVVPASGTALEVTLGPRALLAAGGNWTCQSLASDTAATGTIAGTLSVAGALHLGTNAVLSAGNGLSAAGLALDDGARLAVTGAMTAATLTVGAGATATANGAVTVAGPVALGANATLTVSDTFHAAQVTLASGARIIAGTNVVTSGDIAVGAAASLVVNGSLAAANVNVDGAFGLAAGSTVTSATFAVGAGTAVALTNATLNAGHLVIGAGATFSITQGSLTSDGLTLSGSFTLDDRWGTQARSTLPFADDFENYLAGTPLNALGFRGWGASDSGVVIQSNRTYGGSRRAVDVGMYESISNRIAAATPTNVWTDFEGVWAYGPADELPDVNTNAVALVVMGTNGFLTLFNAGAWDACTNDAWNNPVAAVTNAQWIRVSLNNNFVTRRSALFLDGQLLRQDVPFVNTNVATYSAFRFINQHTATATADDVLITPDVPASLTDSHDDDTTPDAQEIQAHGNTWANPRGAVFKFR